MVQRDYKWLRRSEHRNRLITWLMSGHPRLGQASNAAILPGELRRYITELEFNQ